MIDNIINNNFSEDKYIEFLKKTFDLNIKKAMLKDGIKNEYVDTLQELGSIEIDDIDEVGFFILKSSTTNIEKIRVGFNKFIGNLIKTNKYTYDGLIVAIYHPKSDVWRLSYVALELDDNRELSTQPKRYTFELGNVPTTTAKIQLEHLHKESTLEEIKEAFSVEKLSNEFFREYKKLYFELCDYLNKTPQAMDETEVSLFVKKLLGRIIFLYFLQKKGWLGVPKDKNWGDGDKAYMSSLYTNEYKTNPNGVDFYENILSKIFFDALNVDRKKDNDFFGLLNCKMPFLNGGLFTQDNLDNKNIFLENEIIHKIFSLFDSYNFTIIEDTPHDSEVAIDPEMLGRLFEDLLEDRKDKGAFYTPREIVHYMCQQSIENYLDTKPENKNELEYLKKITILDPAIGSGAFPMGMLHEIVQKRIELGDSTNFGELKREVIENSIYGIDIEPSAVEIAKLRFWLSIVVDENKPTPLPNLFYKIMVGNSLIETINGFDPLEKDNSSLFNTDESIIDEMQDKLHNYFKESNTDKKNKLQESIELSIDEVLGKKLKNHNDEIKSQRNNMSIVDFDNKKTKLIIQLNEEMRLIERVLQKPTTELFFYKLYFKEVLDEGGFDVVIGNPPYVRQEKIKELKSKKEIQDFDSYCGTADLYIYFFEKGYKLLKPNGVLSYITSNKYTRAKYGKNFRKFVLENTAIKEYIDFNGVKVFESATVDTSIMTYQKAKIKDNSFIYCDVDEKYKKGSELNKFIDVKGFKYSQSDLSENSFSFSSPQELKIKKQIEKIGIVLNKWDIKINYGIKTGFNEAFIIDGKIKDELIDKDKKSAEIIKPILRGKDIKKYSYQFADKWLINLHNNPPLDIQEYPAIQKHLDTYYDKLEKRSDQGITPYNLRNCAYLDAFENEKIIYPETVQGAYFYLDTESYYIDKTAFMIIGKDIKYIFALISSKISTYFYKSYCGGVILGEKGYQYNKHAVQKLPIPQIPKEEQKTFEILVDYILFAKEQDMNNEASLFESVIDGMVYDLYFEDDMKKADCFISDEVSDTVQPWTDKTSDEVKKQFITLAFDTINQNNIIQRGLIYNSTVEAVQIINGDN